MNYKNIKIIDIEKELGIIYSPHEVKFTGLPLWYDKIRARQINELTDGDLARFIRQNLYLSFIIPEALRRLNINPAIGDMYYGEVLNSMVKVDIEFWKSNKNILNDVLQLIDKVINKELIVSCDWLYPNEKSEFFNKIKILKYSLLNMDI